MSIGIQTNTMTGLFKKAINKTSRKVAGWCVAALLLFCPFVQADDLSREAIQTLQETYTRLSIDQLIGEYNDVVGYHDDLRANIENQIPEGSKKTTLINQDDEWCRQRQMAWEIGIKEKNKEELSRIIILEFLRCGEMQKVLEGSP
jgi:hypothetical protein